MSAWALRARALTRIAATTDSQQRDEELDLAVLLEREGTVSAVGVGDRPSDIPRPLEELPESFGEVCARLNELARTVR